MVRVSNHAGPETSLPKRKGVFSRGLLAFYNPLWSVPCHQQVKMTLFLFHQRYSGTLLTNFRHPVLRCSTKWFVGRSGPEWGAPIVCQENAQVVRRIRRPGIQDVLKHEPGLGLVYLIYHNRISSSKEQGEWCPCPLWLIFYAYYGLNLPKPGPTGLWY